MLSSRRDSLKSIDSILTVRKIPTMFTGIDQTPVFLNEGLTMPFTPKTSAPILMHHLEEVIASIMVLGLIEHFARQQS
jgi:hypothetical protein